MQTKCKKTSLLSALMDNELTGKPQDDLRAHVAQCVVCQTEMIALKTVDGAVKEISQIDPSPGFNHQFWSKIDEVHEKKAHPWGIWVLNWRSMVAAGLTAGLAIGLYMGIFYPGKNTIHVNQEDLFMAENLEFLSDYEVLQHLDLLEDWDAVNEMKDRT